ncbi:MAG: 2Fe-2S iron-sulfur cluster-binding protein [Thermomicrobiales bacterium]
MRYSDGATTEFSAAAEDTILDAALRAGVAVRYQCESGTCGTCVARLTEGACDMQPDDAPALLTSEIQAGFRQLCVTRPLSDTLCFDLAYPGAGKGAMEIERFSARISDVALLSASVVKLGLTIADPKPFAFQPGQYVRLRVPGTDSWRSYSIATAESDLPRIELLIRLLKDGVASRWLRNGCSSGALVELEGPSGRFVLKQNKGLHVMVAGGTGLAPILSMIDTLDRCTGLRPPILLCFGCNSMRDLFYLDELDNRAFSYPNLEVRIAVADGAPSSPMVRAGTAVSLLDDSDLKRSGAAFYLCGPPPMVAAADERLVGAGVSRTAIFTEQFVPSEG